MGPIRIQTNWRLVVCIWIIAAPVICLGQYGQPIAQLPNGSFQNNPWIGNPPQNGMFPTNGNIPQPSAFPAVTGNFDPVAPAFRPSTAPVYAPTNPYGNFSNPGWNLGNLFGWGQSSAPAFSSNPYGQPNIYPSTSPGVLFPGTGGSQPLSSPWNFPNQTNPYQTNPYQTNPYQANPYLSNPFQPNPYQSNPFGFQQNNWSNWWNNTGANFSAGTNQVIRLFQGPRFRHTWLPGTDGFDGKQPNSLQTNDSDVSLVFAVPNFLNSNRPLYVIPSYSQHEWDGPTVPGSDLPGSAFSAFIDSGWETNPQQTLGVELGVRVGVFSAFNAINSESIRIQGKALGRLRLTPNATLRAGVFYLDRNRIKLLPAFGILWMPNQDTRFDLFFPEPKLAHYVATLGNSDVWWYLSGYYGGGAWTIKQTDGSNDEIDINDIRLMLGLEFGRSDQIRQGFRLGFIEAGYAFNRELLYRVRSSSSLDLENSFVLRAGFAY